MAVFIEDTIQIAEEASRLGTSVLAVLAVENDGTLRS